MKQPSIDVAKISALRDEQITWEEIGLRFGWHPQRIRTAWRRATGRLPSTPNTPNLTPIIKPIFERPETYIYEGQTPNAPIPIFTGWLKISLQQALVMPDLHLPTTSWDFVELMVAFAKYNMRGEKTLILLGDIINGDKHSRHAKNIPMLSTEQELRIAKTTILELLNHFDRIIATPGNHLRNRLIEKLDGDLGMDQVADLLAGGNERFTVTPYDLLQVTSGGERWTLTHQYAYSVNKLVKANELAQKYLTNIMTSHQHHTAVGRDKFNRFTVMDIGGGHDQDGMAYTGLVPNTFPVMNRSFAFLRDGVGHVISPYPTLTDLRMWLPAKLFRKAG